MPLDARSVRVPLSQSRGIEKEMAQVRPSGQRPNDAETPAPPACSPRLLVATPKAPPSDFDEVMGTYDKLFIQYGEALAAIGSEMEVC